VLWRAELEKRYRRFEEGNKGRAGRPEQRRGFEKASLRTPICLPRTYINLDQPRLDIMLMPGHFSRPLGAPSSQIGRYRHSNLFPSEQAGDFIASYRPMSNLRTT
jgi:hypothetical protein